MKGKTRERNKDQISKMCWWTTFSNTPEREGGLVVFKRAETEESGCVDLTLTPQGISFLQQEARLPTYRAVAGQLRHLMVTGIIQRASNRLGEPMDQQHAFNKMLHRQPIVLTFGYSEAED